MGESQGGSGASPKAPPEIPGLRILRTLGAGPHGDVFEVTTGSRTFAAKVFRADVRVSLAAVERLRRGAESRIRHRNLVAPEAIGRAADGRLCIVLPLLVGDSLASILEDLRRGSTDRPSLSPLAVGPSGEIDPNLARHAALLFAEACEGLAAVHRAGLFHGCLHPRNLHLSPAGRLLISDFGMEPEALAHNGDSRYRAPEEADPDLGAPGPRSDVYAIGAMLRDLITLCGKAGEGIPEGLASSIEKALARRPEDRHRDAGELARDLRTFLGVKAADAGAPEEEPDRSVAPAEAASLPAADAPAPKLPAPRRFAAEPSKPFTTAPPASRPFATTPGPAPWPDIGIVEPPIPSGAALPWATSSRGVASTAVPDLAQARSGGFWQKGAWRRWPWRRPGTRLRRAAAALILTAILAAAVLGGSRFRRHLTLQRQGDEVVALLGLDQFESAVAESEKLTSLDPGSESFRVLAEYAGTSGALRSLRTAVSALESSELPVAARALARASSFRPQDGTLRTLATRIDERSREDPLRRELVHPSRWARAAALYRLRLEIEAGERPIDEARLAVRALDVRDPAVIRNAIEVLALLPTTEPLFEAFHIAPSGPEVRLDGETFRLLCEALEERLDAPAAAFLCGVDFGLCQVLDEAPRPVTISVPPNLRIELEPDSPADSSARWLRVMARIDAGELVAHAKQAALREDLLLVVVTALETAGSPEALSSLALLAQDHYLTAGHRALRALSGMGAYAALLRIAQSELPHAYRSLALELLGSQFGGLCREELAGLALRSPEAPIRRVAFRHAMSCGGGTGRDDADAAELLLRALSDPALKSLALEWLHRLPPRLSAPIAVKLLDASDPAVRSHATAILAAEAKGFESFPLLLRLLSSNAEARRAAWALLQWRDDLPSLSRVLGIILHAHETNALGRAALAGESLAIIGERLFPGWLEEAGAAYEHIQAACEKTAARLLAGSSWPFRSGTGR